MYYGSNVTSFYGSSCADNGKGALNTPDKMHYCRWAAHWPRKKNGILRTFWRFSPEKEQIDPPPR
eukprot:864828-Pyramimonas_sp.AAC.1